MADGRAHAMRERVAVLAVPTHGQPQDAVCQNKIDDILVRPRNGICQTGCLPQAFVGKSEDAQPRQVQNQHAAVHIQCVLRKTDSPTVIKHVHAHPGIVADTGRQCRPHVLLPQRREILADNQINVQTAAPTITVNASSADGKGMNEQKLANAIGRILLQQSSASTVKAYSIVV